MLWAGLATAYADAATAQADESWRHERKIQGENNLEPVGPTQGDGKVDQAWRAVASMEHRDGDSFCTASRVGERLFLTNYHCDYACDTIQFRMGFEAGVPVAEQAMFRCSRLVYKNERFDYALYEAEPYLSKGGCDLTAGYPILALSEAPLTIGQRVFVPSHPDGRPKEIDRSPACVVSDVVPFTSESGRYTIKHMCDTEGGSSGAPLIDDATGAAVALHWGGRDQQFNMAIPMSAVLQDLAAHVDPDVYGALQVED